MEKISLSATKRKIMGRHVKKLRREGILPANIYGKKLASQAVEVKLEDFKSALTKAGETSLVELEVEGKKLPVLIHNVQHDPVTNFPLHADFYQVDLKQKVTAKVPLVFIGEAPAVKDKIGVLLTFLSDIEVEALPADLPDKINVDLSGLTSLDQTIKAVDLKISDKIKILTDAKLEIVKVAPLVSKEAEKMAKEEAEKQAATQAAAASAETAAAGVKEETIAASPSTEKAPPSPTGTKS